MIDRGEPPVIGLRPLARDPARQASAVQAEDLFEAQARAQAEAQAQAQALAPAAWPLRSGDPASGRPDFDDFLARLQRESDYTGELVHVERIPPRPARFADLDRPLAAPVARALARIGVERLYTHQARAIELARAERSLVLVTGTASGKTLGYNLPVVERLLDDLDGHALYVFPTKALAQDQLKSLGRLLDAEPLLRSRVRAGVYDGDTSQDARRKLRQEGTVILTNPDMLHQGILPYHTKWARFLRGLRLIVIDEVHTYRGVFGSNVALVLRRLARVARHYGADPAFFCCSATIRNPAELARGLCGREVCVVDDDGSPRGPRTIAFWNPRFLGRERIERRSANVDGERLFTGLMMRGAQTIAFAKSRVSAEIVFRYAHERLLERAPALATRVAPYRSGYLPEERRDIERRLFAGELRGVVSTNALELGIDVGSLDAAVLVGFPPTIASTWQQSGRAGRQGDPALAMVVAYNDPIDQYLMRHPGYFFEQSPEAAVVDPANPYLLAGHLACAAYELPISDSDTEVFGPETTVLVEALSADGQLRPLDGRAYWSSTEYPAGRLNLRTISDNTFTIVDGTDHNAVLGTVDAISAPELVYPEAIYLHEGRSYFVSRLDLEMKVAIVEPREVDYYTQPVLETHILAREPARTRDMGRETLRFGEATVSWATIGMRKIRFRSLDSIGYKALDLPRLTLDTAALGFAPSGSAFAAVKQAGYPPGEALSGLRNLAITLLPLFAMCDPSDVGGVIDSKNLGQPTLFLYDRYPGGLGFAEQAYYRFEELLDGCRRLVDDCPCESGCPSCVGLPILRPPQQQDPDLSNGWPMPSKEAARVLLAAIRATSEP